MEIMKLFAKSIQKLVKGACYFEINRGYITPYKYSKAQLDMMNAEGYDEFWRDRGSFSAGIRLELKTNSDFIAFEYKVAKNGVALCDRSNSVDVWVNGVMHAVLHLDESKGRASVSLPKGDKSVAIYLPVDCQMALKSIETHGYYKSVKDKGQKVLVIGDSITQGYGSMFSSGSYFNELQRMTGYNMLNQGIGGYRCEAKDLMLVDGFAPDKVMTFLGTNWYDAPDVYDYEKATVEFYERLVELYPDKEILSISPIWRGDDGLDPERFLWCTEIVKRECKKHKNITLVDGFTLVPNVLDCYCDKLHPNEYGCYMLAKNIYKAMKKAKF
jgi:hypothetical protein